MAIGFKVKLFWYQVGTSDFLHAFFSTVSYHLEPKGWGSEFPILMEKLYQGYLNWEYAKKAIEELKIIKESLKKFSPNQVIWDIEDISKKPPWGNNISESITDLSNYFVTSDGRDLIELIHQVLKDSISLKSDITIIEL